MNWLSNHSELLFGGVGGTALVAVVGFLLHRYFFKEPAAKANAKVTVRDSQVKGLPVASGSQVTQHNYFTPAPTPVPVAAPANTPTQDKPRPNIVMTAARIARVTEIEGGVFVEDKNGTVEAILIQFTNEARSDGTNVGGFVKASLVFQDEQNEILRITGSWLNTLTDVMEFKVEDTRKLVAGVMFRQELLTIDIVRVGGMLRADSHVVTSVQTQLVKLTNANNGDVLYQGQFRVTLNPLGIVREYVGRVDVTLP